MKHFPFTSTIAGRVYAEGPDGCRGDPFCMRPRSYEVKSSNGSVINLLTATRGIEPLYCSLEIDSSTTVYRPHPARTDKPGEETRDPAP